MFKKLTKRIVADAKESVKEEVTNTIDNKYPMIIGMVSVGLILYNICGSAKKEPVTSGITIINNIYNGGLKQ